MRNLLNRRFGLVLYALCFTGSAVTLWQGVNQGLFPPPGPGTDQLTMLQAAVGLYFGKLPPPDYLYSPSYTVFLGLLVLVTHGNLFFIRLLQAAVCALVPVVIYRFGRTIRLPRTAAQLGGIVWCLYGPATLLSVDLLREVPLCLCFALYAWLLARGFLRRRTLDYALAGACMGLCILGRENFIPIAAVPAVMLLWPAARRRLKPGPVLSHLAAIAAVVLPVMCYNLWRSGHFAIVPGHAVNIIFSFHGTAATRDPLVAITSILHQLPRQLYLFVRMYELDNSLSFYAHREMIPALNAMFVPYNVILGLAAAGLLACRRHPGVRFAALLALGYVGTMVYFELFYRYRIPVVVMLAVLAGAGIWRIAAAGSWKRALPPLLLAALVAGVTLDFPNRIRRPEERYAVVRAMLLNRQFDRAETYIRQLDREDIPTGKVKARLIGEMIKAGDSAGAARLQAEYAADSEKTARSQQ